VKRALITGGAGFIGSHLVLAPRTRGPVAVLDNLYRGRQEALAGCLNQVRLSRPMSGTQTRCWRFSTASTSPIISPKNVVNVCLT
jgi:nucleoside-diphosphate-sugar epimerase